MISRIFIMIALGFITPLGAAEKPIRAGEFEQRIGQSIPTRLIFQNEVEQIEELDSIVAQGQPILLSLVYFHCKTLCPLIMNGITKAINDMPDDASNPFQIVIVSLDPKDTAADAAQRKSQLLKRSGSFLQSNNLHMLRGEESVIQKLATAIGFHYQYDPKSGQYEHPSGLVVLTSDGRVARYFFGIEFNPDELHAALQRASKNHLDHLISQIRLACFRYNAETGTYSLAIYKIMRILSVCLLVIGVVTISIWERQRPQPKRMKDS